MLRTRIRAPGSMVLIRAITSSPPIPGSGAATSLRSSSDTETANPYSKTRGSLSRAADSYRVFTAADGEARAQLFVGRPARRNPTLSVWSWSAQFWGLVTQALWRRIRASELISGFNWTDSARAALAASISPRRPNAPAKYRCGYQIREFAVRDLLRKSMAGPIWPKRR